MVPDKAGDVVDVHADIEITSCEWNAAKWI